MREKQWIDCPVCGARKSMRTRKDQEERFNPSGYPPLDISGLEGRFCEVCGEGFWSLKSERRIARLLAEHMADHDAQRVVAAELTSVKEAATVMDVTAQAIHKMMKEGRLKYVVAGGARLPLRRDLMERARTKRHASPC